MLKNILNHLKAKSVCAKEYGDSEIERLKRIVELKDKERKANWYKQNSSKVKENTSKRLKNRSMTEIAIDKQVKKSYDKERRNQRSSHQINMEKEKKKVYNAKWLKENAKGKKGANKLNNFISREKTAYCRDFNFQRAKTLVMSCFDGKISNLKLILETENDYISELPESTSKLDVSEMFIWFDNEIENLRDALAGTIDHFFASIEDILDKKLIEKKIRYLNQHIYGCLSIFDCQVKDLLKETNNFERKNVESKIKSYHDQMGEKIESFDDTIFQQQCNFEQSNDVDFRELCTKFKKFCSENLRSIFKKYSCWTKKYQDYIVQMEEWKNDNKPLKEILATIDSDMKKCQEELEQFHTVDSNSEYETMIDEDFEANFTYMLFSVAKNMESSSKSIRFMLWNGKIFADSVLELYGVTIEQGFDEQWFGFFPRKFKTVCNESEQKEIERFAQNARSTVIEFMSNNSVMIDYEDLE